MFGGPVHRPVPGLDHRAARWLDTLGVDSLYDYDPVWARCAELGVSPTFHNPSMGWSTHSSVSSYVYNHIGMFTDQLLDRRYLPGWGYRTPIDRLWMCGPSCHPGGGVTGGGRAAVQSLMTALGIDAHEAIRRAA